MLEIQGAAYSDIGHVRQKNEDNFYCQGYFRRGYQLASTYDKTFHASGDCQVYAISDGMGGMAKGEIASRIAVSELGAFERDLARHREVPVEQAVIAYLTDRNNQIVARNQAAGDPREGMGATISLLIFANGKALLANMGDTAVFHWRQDQLKQISRDDSHAARLRSLGYLTSAEAKTHPLRNSLTNYLGKDTQGEPLGYFLVPNIPIEEHDLFLLCSDGISGFVSREAIRNVLSLPTTVEEKAHELVNLAEAAGSSDNVTLILLEILQSPDFPKQAFLVEGDDIDTYNPNQGPLETRSEVTRAVHPMEAAAASQTVQAVRPVKPSPPVEPLSAFPSEATVVAPKQAAGPTKAPEVKRVSPKPSAELRPEEAAAYDRMRLEALERQNARKAEQNMKQHSQGTQVPPSGQPSEQVPPTAVPPAPIPAADQPYAPPRAQAQAQAPISREQKARIYDNRYSDSGETPAVSLTSAPSYAGRQSLTPEGGRKKRGGLGRFFGWLIFLLVFVGIGYGIFWLLVYGTRYLPF